MIANLPDTDQYHQQCEAAHSIPKILNHDFPSAPLQQLGISVAAILDQKINGGIDTPWIDNHLTGDMGGWTRISTFSANVFARGGAGSDCRKRDWRMKPGWTAAMLAGSSEGSTI